MATIKIRPALATDLPQTVSLDIAANPDHPIMTIPWKQFSHKYGVWLSRHLYFLNHPEKFQFLVATTPSSSQPSGEEIVGILVGTLPENDVKAVEEWKPIFPEGTQEDVIMYFLGVVEGDKKKYHAADMWELELFCVSVEHQRQGIGAKMMQEWLKPIDEDGRPLYIFASVKGKGLYEKFGCKVVGTLNTNLKDFGVEQLPHPNFHMVRDGKK
ncbi:uncharacterized protein LY89DRAFT_177897 [Mollisia scopiformis]|uniref:N-acetyltransferase domain-containing protein n=1 Tax=Mollisia scopiformis TaxID=149040 RepID=A0A194XU98_MOLSC|nr:uncharacterized protein LY89DRAFT_177897 [Mollisia scopiformis]KUJ23282.1 hypothetical protein LY89DRAFT_177897 [Mollisia scopiformis]